MDIRVNRTLVGPSRSRLLLLSPPQLMARLHSHVNGLRAFCALVLIVLAHGAQSAEPMAAPFAPLGLDRLIALSIQSHPSISVARAQLGAAQSGVDAARAQYYPTPSLQLLQDGKGDDATVLTVQQPLWTGGRIDAGWDAARSRAHAAKLSIAEARRDLALRVITVWAAWLQAHGRGEALKEGVRLLSGYTESVNRRIEGGVSAVADRELVASRLAQTQGDLAAAKAAEQVALGRLTQLVGQQGVGQPLRSKDLAVPSLETSTALPALEALVAQAQARSTALQRIEADIETAHHEVLQKRAVLWPNLSLRAQHQRSAANTTDANDNRVMLVLDYAPGAGLSAGAEIAATESRRQALREQLAAARSELMEGILSDHGDYRASTDRVQSLQHTLRATAAVLDSYDRLFIAGKRGWLDVINAARELIQVRTLLADTQAQQAAAHARLRLHLGELF